MRIVVTGTTGKLGSEVMKAMPKAIPFYREDFNDPKEKLKDADVIIHIAGCIRGSFGELYKGNVETTEILLNNSPKLKKFIYISTAVEFGDYCLTKRSAEKRVKESGKPYVILRPTMILFKDDDRMLNKLIKLIDKIPIIPLPGGGRQLIQPVWHEDVVKAIIKSMKAPKDSTYYVAGSEQMTMREFIDRTAGFLNKERYILPLPKFMIYLNPLLSLEEKQRFFDNKIYDISKTRKELDLNPVSFNHMLNEVEI